MNRKLLPAILGAALLCSCYSGAGKQGSETPLTPRPGPAQPPYVITDYKNKSAGGAIPEWVSLSLEGNLRHLETEAYEDHYVFVSRNEGNNFSALTQWTLGFSPELDFPRLAAARIEARFSSGVPFPEQEYGAFFEEMIRTASDAVWTGAAREDDFWVHKIFFHREDETGSLPAAVSAQSQEKESWEFFILAVMEKKLFASQLDAVFRNIKPNPAPRREQTAAANRVKEKFFSGF
jgi:hypothetical protein